MSASVYDEKLSPDPGCVSPQQGAVHQHIYESDQFGVLDAEAYLARVLSGLRDFAPPGVRLAWTLAPLQLSSEQALPLGLIVNEMVSGAFKHGFPDGRPGKVDIALE